MTMKDIFTFGEENDDDDDLFVPPLSLTILKTILSMCTVLSIFLVVFMRIDDLNLSRDAHMSYEQIVHYVFYSNWFYILFLPHCMPSLWMIYFIIRQLCIEFKMKAAESVYEKGTSIDITDFNSVYANGSVTMDGKYIRYSDSKEEGTIFKRTKSGKLGYVSIDSISNACMSDGSVSNLWLKIKWAILSFVMGSSLSINVSEVMEFNNPLGYMPWLRHTSNNLIVACVFIALLQLFWRRFKECKIESTGKVIVCSDGNNIALDFTSKEEARQFFSDLENVHSYTSGSNAGMLSVLEDILNDSSTEEEGFNNGCLKEEEN